MGYLETIVRDGQPRPLWTIRAPESAAPTEMAPPPETGQGPIPTTPAIEPSPDNEARHRTPAGSAARPDSPERVLPSVESAAVRRTSIPLQPIDRRRGKEDERPSVPTTASQPNPRIDDPLPPDVPACELTETARALDEPADFPLQKNRAPKTVHRERLRMDSVDEPSTAPIERRTSSRGELKSPRLSHEDGNERIAPTAQARHEPEQEIPPPLEGAAKALLPVTPAEARVQNLSKFRHVLDSRLRGNDGSGTPTQSCWTNEGQHTHPFVESTEPLRSPSTWTRLETPQRSGSPQSATPVPPPQPKVQIGRVDIVVHAGEAAQPKRPSTPPASSLASRQFLRRL